MMKETSQYHLLIDGNDIFNYKQQLYYQLIYFPAEVIKLFDRVSQKVFLENFADEGTLINFKIQMINNAAPTKKLSSTSTISKKQQN